MSFKDDVKIDINHLDKDTIEQVPLYEEWSRNWADAITHRDRLKEQLSVIKAEADVEIRANPSKFGWSSERSPTEAWVATQITLHETVKLATKDYLDAAHEANIMAVAKETLEHRKKALEILTELYKGQYFCAVSRSNSDYRKAVTDEGKEAQSETLNKSERLRRRRSNE